MGEVNKEGWRGEQIHLEKWAEEAKNRCYTQPFSLEQLGGAVEEENKQPIGEDDQESGS